MGGEVRRALLALGLVGLGVLAYVLLAKREEVAPPPQVPPPPPPAERRPGGWVLP